MCPRSGERFAGTGRAGRGTSIGRGGPLLPPTPMSHDEDQCDTTLPSIAMSGVLPEPSKLVALALAPCPALPASVKRPLYDVTRRRERPWRQAARR